MRLSRATAPAFLFLLALTVTACSAKPAVISPPDAAASCATGKLACQGTCVDTATDPKHCGKCDNACGSANVCTDGICVLTCVSPRGACSGACVDTTSSHDHCGICGMVCGPQQVCSSGACSDSCPEHQVKCGTTCVDPAVDLQQCGATAGCGLTAGSAGAACVGGQRCSGGHCTCPPGWLFCNGMCVDPSQDRNRCGATACNGGVVCAVNEICSGGACTPTCPVGLLKCDGTCIDPNTDRSRCGATSDCDVDGGTTGNACAAGEVCSAGSCALSCQTGMVKCDGVCVDPKTSRLFCGATPGCGTGGGSPGAACEAGQVCSGGSCTVSCQPGMVKCDGICIDPAASRAHCGASGNCTDVGAGNSAGAACASGNLCVSGSCAVSCPTGSVNCGGVCVNPNTDNGHCGAFGDCTNLGAGNNAGSACTEGQVCNNRVCAVVCQTGLVNCGGVCIDPGSSRAYCGATGDCTTIGAGNSAGTTCAAGNLCVAGNCTVSCPTGSVNCGGVCINPQTDNGHCGAGGDCSNIGTGNSAGSACAQGRVCNGGSCAVICQTGLVNCAGVCTDPSTSRAYCGAAGNCTNVGSGNSAGAACPAGNLCVAGSCTVSCPTGSVNCGGACVNAQADNTHCGAAGDCTNVGSGNSAGSACAQGRVCNGGACAVVCQPGLVNCGGLCVDPSTSRAYCGASGDCTNVGSGNSAGAACPAGNLCVAGSCTVSCPMGSVNCGGVCVNPSTDNSRCGAAGDCTNVGTGNSAGNVCTGGAVCSAGACTLSCSGGLHMCNTTCVDWLYNPSHCGGCGNACSSNHITQATCFASSCNGACDPGYVDCDGDKLANGCESNPTSDAANCGTCSVAGDHNCNRNATGGICTSGVCSGATCSAGFANCDALASNGCETALSSAVSSSTPGYSSITNYFSLNGTVGAIANNATIPASIGSNGTAGNGNNNGMAYATGQLSQALNLDGSDDTVDLGVAVGNFGTADFSIAMWLKTTPIGRTQWVLTKRAYCTHAPFWNVGIASNGRLIFEIDQDYSGTNYGNINGTTNITDNVWHHIAFVRQGTAMSIYLDGNLDGSGVSSGVTNLMESYNVRIGRIACASGQNFRGQLDDLAIWTGYALTLADQHLITCAGGH